MKRINLIPKDIQSQSSVLRLLPFKWVVSAISILAVLFLWQVTVILRYSFNIRQQRQLTGKLQGQLNTASDAIVSIKAEREKVNARRTELVQRLSLLKDKSHQGIDWSGVLIELSKLIPKEIWIKNLKIDEISLIITGSSTNNTVISDFMENLDKAPLFEKTDFNFIRRAEDEKSETIEFEIKTTLNRQEIEKLKK